MLPESKPMKDLPPTEEAALWAYRMILGREPESEAIVTDHVRCSTSLADMRERFLESSEFTQRYRTVERERGRNVSVFPPCSIQTRVDGETAKRLFERVALSWQHMGETEPYWSVLAEPQYLTEHIGGTREAFIDSGRENVERLLATLRRNDVTFNPEWEALELGCGLGRSTRWLALHVRKLWAVDVSDAHLRLARQLNADAPCVERIEWLRLHDMAAMEALPEFDLFFSMIVLQHNPPPVIAAILEIIAAKLRQGGIAFFQVPTYQRGYSFDAESYLDLRANTRDIEMHAFPQGEVFRIFRKHGCIPLEVFEDGLSGHRDNHRSNSFLFRKSSTPCRSDEHESERVVELEAEIARTHARARSDHDAAQKALADAAHHYRLLKDHAAALEARCVALQARLDEAARS